MQFVKENGMETVVTVRFAETDALGHVNNTSYFIYFEEARLQFLKELGQKMDVTNWSFILASTKCDFLSQAYFDQQLKIDTSVSKVGTKSFELNHFITCKQTGVPIAKGNAILVQFNFDKQESEPVPELLRTRLMSLIEVD